MTNPLSPSDQLSVHVDEVLTDIAGDIDTFDQDFCRRMYADRFENYAGRLRAIGFEGHEKVLDAGCGFGQWSVSLAQLNRSVEACDISPSRIEFVNRLARKLGLGNLSANAYPLDQLGYEDNTFDAVFCYGVIFLTPWRTSLAELHRVLKPGGRFYINANGLGWFLFLWKTEHNKIDGYDPKREAAESFAATIDYARDQRFTSGKQLIIEPEEMQEAMEALGFEAIQMGAEGSLKLSSGAPDPTPNFKGTYEGHTGVYEMVAVKVDATS